MTDNWEMFEDDGYYGMWAVRPKGDRGLNSPQLFHFTRREDAEDFKALAERAVCAFPSPPGAKEGE